MDTILCEKIVTVNRAVPVWTNVFLLIPSVLALTQTNQPMLVRFGILGVIVSVVSALHHVYPMGPKATCKSQSGDFVPDNRTPTSRRLMGRSRGVPYRHGPVRPGPESERCGDDGARAKRIGTAPPRLRVLPAWPILLYHAAMGTVVFLMTRG